MSFIEKPPLLDAFKFGTTLSIHITIIRLQLDLLYPTINIDQCYCRYFYFKPWYTTFS
jgi:hypothetical protein